MNTDSLHNMLKAVMGGKEETAQMHFHDYLKDKFPDVIGKGIEADAGQTDKTEQLDSNKE